MLQIVDGLPVYVVDLKTMPKEPIITGGFIVLEPYVQALNAALNTGVITEPGKYGIHVDPDLHYWNVFKIIEN